MPMNINIMMKRMMIRFKLKSKIKLSLRLKIKLFLRIKFKFKLMMLKFLRNCWKKSMRQVLEIRIQTMTPKFQKTAKLQGILYFNFLIQLNKIFPSLKIFVEKFSGNFYTVCMINKNVKIKNGLKKEETKKEKKSKLFKLMNL